MREQALRAKPRRRRLPKDREQRIAIADNVLDQQFQADGPNQKWVADFVYTWTAEGWLYVAAVLDLYVRRIVGWSRQDSMTSQLVVDALMMAVRRRGKPMELLNHLDQGSQHVSEHFQTLLKEQDITCSISRTGDVLDNSAMESFFSPLKTQRTTRKVYHTREQVRADVGLHRAVLQPDAASLNALVCSVPYSLSTLKRKSVSTQPAAAHSRSRRSRRPNARTPCPMPVNSSKPSI